MTSWKLVEAIPEAVSAEIRPSSKTNNSGSQFGNRGQGGRGRSNNKSRSSFNGRGRGRDGRDGSGLHQGHYQLSQTDRNYLAYLAVQQIELLFNPDNLCMDTYIRSFMDEAGFIPVAVALNYPNVAAVCAVYEDILHRLQENSTNSILEVDPMNETIRLKIGWEMWLMPNCYGGRGQPRYIKQFSGNDGLYQSNIDVQSQAIEFSAEFPNTAEVATVQQEEN